MAKQLDCEMIEVRDCERGLLKHPFAFCEVWTVREEARQDAEGRSYTGVRPVKELLVSRHEGGGTLSDRLSKASLAMEKPLVAQWKTERYFVERTIQDAKMEAGGDDLSSPKYRAYMHTLASDALAIWFVARVKLKMRNQYASPAECVSTVGVRRLPDRSFANVRVLLRTVFPLTTLTKEDAIEFVTRHLVGRTKSTRSRLKGTKIII